MNNADRRTSLGQERRFRKQQQQQQRSNISEVTNRNRPIYSSDDDDDDVDVDDEEEQLDRHLSAMYGEAQEEPAAADKNGKKRKKGDNGKTGNKPTVDEMYDDDDSKPKKPRPPRPSVKIGDLTGPNGLIRIPKEFAQRLHYGGKKAKLQERQQHQRQAALKHNIDASATFSRQLMQQYKVFSHDLCMGLAWQDVLLAIETSLGSKKEVKDFIHQMRQDQRNQYLEQVLGREKAEVLIQELQEEKEQLQNSVTQEKGHQQGEANDKRPIDHATGENDDDDDGEQEVTFMDGEEPIVAQPRPFAPTVATSHITTFIKNAVNDDNNNNNNEEDDAEDEEIVNKASNTARRQRLRVFEDDVSDEDEEEEAAFTDNENDNKQNPMEAEVPVANLLQNPKTVLEDTMCNLKKTVVDDSSEDDEEEEAEFQDTPMKPTADNNNKNDNEDMDEDMKSIENANNESNQTESSEKSAGEENDQEMEATENALTEKCAPPSNETTIVGNDPSNTPLQQNEESGASNHGMDMTYESFNQSSPSPKATTDGTVDVDNDDDLGSQVGMHLAQTQLTPTFSQQTDATMSQEFMVPPSSTATTPWRTSLVATLQENQDSHMAEGLTDAAASDAAASDAASTTTPSPMSGPPSPAAAASTTQASASMILEDDEKTIIASSASQDTLIPESQCDLSTQY